MSISFDTFAGPRGVREADLDAEGLLGLVEQPTPMPQLFPPPSPPPGASDGDSSDENDGFYESQDDDDGCDLFHEKDGARQGHNQIQDQDEKQDQASGGRIRQLVELLMLQSHNVGDARSALVNKLLGVVKVHELLLSRATEDQIADAANDAITDEIMASVDLEERRRSELAIKEQQLVALQPAALTSTSTIFDPGQLSPFRVLELVDVLDSTTGGMVKRVLTKVRRRAPLNAKMVRDNEMEKDVEFCRFCSAYGDHTAAQHRCRLCGVAGHHRSQSCPYRGTARAMTSSPSANAPASTATRSASTVDDQKFCTLCNSWGLHATERHRCRTCGAHGAHRSQRCPVSSSSSLVPWIGSPADLRKARKHCAHCKAWRPHASDEHRCRLCGVVGDHGSKSCPRRVDGVSPSAGQGSYAHHADDTSPAVSPARATAFCSFCRRKAAHATSEHLCRVCRAVGLHRSDGCPQRSTVLSYSVDAASKVRDRVLEKIPQVLPPPAVTLVWRSLDKVGDADLILRKTLQRIGVWGGGSQTPITTPYAPPSASSSSADASSDGTTTQDGEAGHLYLPELESQPRGSSSSYSSAPLLLDEGRSSGVYVLAYAEGSSVVPARILKYMRLLMHHEVSTNAFSVVVRFDPRPSHWELMKPGMVSPRSLPSSPTLSQQLQKRMAHYTLQTLLGARDKLHELETARRKLQQQFQAQLHAQKTRDRAKDEQRPDEQNKGQVVMPVGAE